MVARHLEHILSFSKPRTGLTAVGRIIIVVDAATEGCSCW